MGSIGKIQRFPRGLLQFLGMVGTGQAPTDLSDEVVATVDLTGFYGELSGISFTGTLTNVGDAISVTVPNHQAWMMISGVCNFTAQNVGEAARLSYFITPVNSIAARVHSGPLLTAVNAGNSFLATSFLFPQRTILHPGSTINAILDMGGVALARSANVSALFYKIAV